MAISFNQNSVFNLRVIDISNVRNDVRGLLIENEEIIAAFKTVRDQLVFTNKRIISIDVQGVTGFRKSFTTMPYSKIQFFTIQTPAFMEIISDAELFVIFADGTKATFEIKGSVDIGKIARSISQYVLK